MTIPHSLDHQWPERDAGTLTNSPTSNPYILILLITLAEYTSLSVSSCGRTIEREYCTHCYSRGRYSSLAVHRLVKPILEWVSQSCCAMECTQLNRRPSFMSPLVLRQYHVSCLSCRYHNEAQTKHTFGLPKIVDGKSWPTFHKPYLYLGCLARRLWGKIPIHLDKKFASCLENSFGWSASVLRKVSSGAVLRDSLCACLFS